MRAAPWPRVPASRRAIRAIIFILALSALLSLLALAGCAGPGYYVQAVDGHLSLMRKRQDIDAYLAQADADDPLAERLTLARDVLAFAEEELGLPSDGAYRQVAVTGRDAVTWNVVATPPLSLAPRKWCFIVAGCVGYRGYYDRDDAQRFAARLREDGNDVMTFPASAYSTLGWFDDPLLDTMLNAPDPAVAGTLIHELAHLRLYVPGDTTFSESYASFVEDVGVRRWLQATGRGEQYASWKQRREWSGEWRKRVGDYRDRLNDAFAADRPDAEKLADKRRLFESFRAEYDELRTAQWNGADPWAWFFSQGANNAALALVGQYQGGHCAFEALYESVDGDIGRFHRAAAGIAERDADSRARWLEAPCP